MKTKSTTKSATTTATTKATGSGSAPMPRGMIGDAVGVSAYQHGQNVRALTLLAGRIPDDAAAALIAAEELTIAAGKLQLAAAAYLAGDLEVYNAMLAEARLVVGCSVDVYMRSPLYGCHRAKMAGTSSEVARYPLPTRPV